MVLAVIAVISTLILVVGVHELGHALAAWWFGVKVTRISVGFGKPLFILRKQNGPEWVWALWPLGGAVGLLNTRITPVPAKEFPYCFDKQSIWRRIVILLAGSAANFVLAWLALVLVFSIGFSYKIPTIQSVQAQSIAALAGIQPGAELIAIGGEPTPTWREVGMQLVRLWGQKQVPVTVYNAQHEAPKVLNLDLSKVSFAPHHISLLSSLGLTPNIHAPKGWMRAPNLLQAMYESNKTIGNMVSLFVITFKQVLLGVIPFAALLGPWGFFSEAISSFMHGLAVFLYFIASISVAVGIVNLLPIPVLDGGSIVYALLEKIRKKPISIPLEILIHRLFVIAFCLVLVHLITNDLQRIYS